MTVEGSAGWFSLAPDGEQDSLAVQGIVAAVGYRRRPLDCLPFDEPTGTLPNDDGRVAPGVYAAGWIKRGPTGVIGTNKADAAETVRMLLADLPHLPPATQPDPAAVDALLTRAVRPVGPPAAPRRRA